MTNSLKPHTIYENNIDNRKVICECGEEGCKIGLNLDCYPNVMRLTDKFGNEHTMYLNKENTKQIIEYLKDMKF